jgi:hypothetical protein
VAANLVAFVVKSIVFVYLMQTKKY